MAEATVNSGGITRREFLFYIWGASMALFTVESIGATIWFLIPRFRAGEFGGAIPLTPDKLPAINAEPFDNPDGRFWLANLDTTQGNELMERASDENEDIVGVVAIYKVCTHLGCIYAWVPANQRFECPCHGSKYRLDGRRIESPAPRSLDRFKVKLVMSDGQEIESEQDGDGFWKAVPIPGGNASDIAEIVVDTGARQKGPSLTLLCDFKGECP